MSARPGCWKPADQFRPQWAYETPAGSRDEPYIVPVEFTFLANGRPVFNLPVQLDDDVPFILRGIQFPELGLELGVHPRGIARIRDSHGNPLSEGLVMGLGAWGDSGIQDANAFGFAVEPEVVCEPGGVLIFDFAISSTGNFASFLKVGALEQIRFYAAVFGTGGNVLTIQLINPGAANIPLSVVLVGNAVQVTLQTDGAAVLISTYQQVADIINNTPAIAAVMRAFLTGTNPAEVITAQAVTPLAGGLNGGNVTLLGSLIGAKRFQECDL